MLLKDILHLSFYEEKNHGLKLRCDRTLEMALMIAEDNNVAEIMVFSFENQYLGTVNIESIKSCTSQLLFSVDNLFRVVLDENPNIVILKDWEGRFITANKALAKLYGTDVESLVGKSDSDFNPNEEQVKFYLKNIQSIMEEGKTQIVYEESTDVETGKVRYYQSIKKPLKDNNGNLAILVLANDITEIKEAQQKIEQSQKQLSYVLEATNEGVWDWNLQTGELLHNSTWYHLLGYSADEMTGTMNDFLRCLVDEDKEEILKAVQLNLEGRSSYYHEHRMRTKEGQIIWVLDRGNVVERDHEGKPLRMVGSFANITERKQAENALKELNIQLEAKVQEGIEVIRQKEQILLHQAKLASMGEMISAIAHQWRQPLNAVGILIQDLLDAYRYNDLTQEYLENNIRQAMEQVTFMSKTIDNFRHFFQPRLEGREHFSLLQVIKESCQLWQTQLLYYGIDVIIEGDDFIVDGFKDELKQVILNIVSNARDAINDAKEKGSIVEGKVVIFLDSHQKLVSFKNNGEMISDEIMTRIFEPYFTTKEQGKGTGIGLYMSKMILEKMKATISCKNENDGVCFNLKF